MLKNGHSTNLMQLKSRKIYFVKMYRIYC